MNVNTETLRDQIEAILTEAAEEIEDGNHPQAVRGTYEIVNHATDEILALLNSQREG